MNKITFFFFIFLPSLIFSQVIKVVDLETKYPIAGVVVFSKKLSEKLLTNYKGEIKLPKVSNEPWFEFKVKGYFEVNLSFSEIKSLNYVVEMKPLKESLQEVMIYSSENNLNENSNQIIKIPRSKILQSNGQTTADLINKEGNVFVQKSQLGGGSPFLRGFSANRLLISIDGVRFNNATFRSGNVQNIISIDPLFLESSKIVLGSSSVKYGSDAIGGALDFKTLTPKFNKDGFFNITGNALYRFSSANSENTFHTDLFLEGGKIASVTSFSHNNFSDLTQGSNGNKDYLSNEFVDTIEGVDVVIQNSNPKKQVLSGYKQFNLLHKTAYKPNKNLSFNLNFIYTKTSKYNRYDRLQRVKNGQFRHSEWFYSPQEWLMISNGFSYKKKHFFIDKLNIINSYQTYKEGRNVRNFGSQIRTVNNEKTDIYSLNINAGKELKRVKFSYGFEYIFNKVFSNAYELNIINRSQNDLILTRYPNGSTWQSVSGYVTGKFNIHPKLSITSGIRYNRVLLNSSFNKVDLDFPFSEAKINAGAVTGAFGLVYNPKTRLFLKFNANTSFKSPNIDDVGKTVLNSEPGTLIVPNPNLKPEYAYNGDLSIEYVKSKFECSLIGHYTFLDRALTRDNFTLNGESQILFRGEESRVLAIQNSSNLFTLGVEFNVKMYLLKNIIASGSYTLLDGRNTLPNESKIPVRHISPNFGNFHLKYHNKKWSIDAFLEFNGGFSFNELAPSEQSKVDIYAKDNSGNPFLPAWYTLNVKSRIDLTNKIKLISSIENITDKRYRTYSSGISAPGFNVTSSLLLQF